MKINLQQYYILKDVLTITGKTELEVSKDICECLNYDINKFNYQDLNNKVKDIFKELDSIKGRLPMFVLLKGKIYKITRPDKMNFLAWSEFDLLVTNSDNIDNDIHKILAVFMKNVFGKNPQNLSDIILNHMSAKQAQMIVGFFLFIIQKFMRNMQILSFQQKQQQMREIEASMMD